MLAKQGKLGTKGFNVMRGRRKTCKSTTWKITEFLAKQGGEKIIHSLLTDAQQKYLNGCFQPKCLNSNGDIRISSPFYRRLHNQLLLISHVNFHPYEYNRKYSGYPYKVTNKLYRHSGILCV